MVRTLAVSKLKKRINDILVFARHVADSMRNNPDFPSPPPALARLAGHIDAATRAQAAVLSRTVDAATKRNGKVALVKIDVEQLRVHVQGVADAAGPEDAARIIVSAGFFVKRKVARKKQTLSAGAGKTSGSVRLTAIFAGKVALYAWAYSLDQRTWTEVAQTMKAKTTIPSLVPGTKYFFRARALHRKGWNDWSVPIAFLVV
jgi:hypothetical protein